MSERLVEQLYDFIRSASTDLPSDVEAALRAAQGKEPPGAPAADTFAAILDNVAMARRGGTPICQDTGSMVFYVHHPVGLDVIAFRAAIEAAAERATRAFLLRPNAVHPLTGKNSGTNVGVNAPYVTFKAWEKDEVRVRLMLKGGGSENVGTQYKLPDGALGAGRDLKGVRKCVVDAVFKAQGMGCAPGRHRRRHRRRPRHLLPAVQGAVLPPPGLGQRGPGAGRLREGAARRPEPAGHRADGLRRADHGARRVRRLAAPPPGHFLRRRLLHVLGLPAQGDDAEERGGLP